jgi:parallel beta-helix repeat protein
VAFTTDGSGSYTFEQNLAIPHFVFIQSYQGTIFIPGDTSIGNWDPDTRTYTLTTDVFETIQIDEGDLTLDGGGHIVSGSGSGDGLYIHQRNGITIENIRVQKFSCGVLVRRSHDTVIRNNTFDNNGTGILFYWDVSSTAENNILTNNNGGIRSDWSNDGRYATEDDENIIIDNTIDSTMYGVILGYGDKITVQRNTITNTRYGIYTRRMNYGDGAFNFSYNNIEDYSQYAWYQERYGRVDLSAEYNWWGTADQSAIDAAIIDENDDGITGQILYCPWLLEPYPTELTSLAIDNDSDGYNVCEDCDDADATVNPGIDSDDDGWDMCVDCDDNDAGLNYDDLDGDSVSSCDGDCDDTDPSIYPPYDDLHITEDTTFKCTGTYEVYDEGEYGIVFIDAPGITVDFSGLTLKIDSALRTGSVVECRHDNVVIKNLNVEGYVIGVDAQYRYNVDVMNCSFTNCQYAIRPAADTTIRNNSFYGCNVGIQSLSGRNNTVTNNHFEGNHVGIYAYSSHDNLISDNSFVNNLNGGLAFSRMTNSTVSHNLIQGTGYSYAGIGLYDYTTDNEITNNTISGHRYGLSFYNSSNNNTLAYNSISNSTYYGAYFSYNCSGNILYNNNFVNNATQAYLTQCGANIFNLAAPTGGNYWSNHTTPDADGDGFVDNPCVFEGGQDDLPWTCPLYATLVGDNVLVDLVDPETGETLVTLTFDEVTEAGVSAVTTTTPAEHQGPPQGFKVGQPPTIFNISSTATSAGNVEVCLSYSGISFQNESTLELFHYENDQWVAVTTTLDTENDIICGIVTSLSPFAIFELGNRPPEVVDISAPGDPVHVNAMVEVHATFSDPDVGDTHTAIWDWGDGNTSDGIVDEGAQTVSGNHTYLAAGVYTVTLTVTDKANESDTDGFEFVVVYDPSGGFVTGGGWIYSPAGALLDSDAEGKASFGFVAKYKKGATVPQGNTEFRFQAGDFRFKSSSYEWLVIAGSKAKFKGQGFIDGVGEGFKFMLTAVDGSSGAGYDRFRIKIWQEEADSELVVYDNKRGEDDDAELDDTTIIGGGSIVIHQK